MALGFGEARIIAAVAGAWVTAFVLVAIWMPSALVLVGLGVLAVVGAYLIMKMLHYKLLSAYAVGSAIVLFIAAAFRSGLF